MTSLALRRGLRYPQDLFWGIWGSLQDTVSPPLPLNGHAKMWWCQHGVDMMTTSYFVTTSRGLYAGFPRIDAADTTGWCWRAEAKGGGHAGGGHCHSRRTQNGACDAGRGRVQLDLVAAAAPLACSVWPHRRLRCMQPLLGRGMGVVMP